MNKTPLTQADLRMSCGTETWTRHPLARNVLISAGLLYIAEKGLWWLVDAIASHEALNRKLLAERRKDPAFRSLRFWTLEVDINTNKAVLACRLDSGKPAIVTQRIPFTDCPLPQVKVYAGQGESGTVLLSMPSEN